MTMGLKQNLKADFPVDVRVIDPAGDETIVEMRFKRLRLSEFKNTKMGDDADGIQSMVTGWDAEAMGVEFSKEAMADMIDAAPWLPMCMFRSYAEALQGLIRKN